MAESFIEGCPVCFDPFSAPIWQCKSGHSICGECVDTNNLTICPICRGAMSSTRNYQLEELIEKLKGAIVKRKCMNFDSGCRHEIIEDDREDHHKECSKRDFICEGRIFCKWTCDWTGKYEDLLQHFNVEHRDQLMEFKCDRKMKLDLQVDNGDVWLVNFNNGAQFFWFKYQVDGTAQKVYFYNQFIGTKQEAKNYYYEFEISEGNTRKLKVTEICESVAKSDKEIWASERCAAFSFASIKTYLNKSCELHVRFRIMGIKREPPIVTAPVPKPPQPLTNANRSILGDYRQQPRWPTQPQPLTNANRSILGDYRQQSRWPTQPQVLTNANHSIGGGNRQQPLLRKPPQPLINAKHSIVRGKTPPRPPSKNRH